METLPSYIAIGFVITTFLTVYLFYKASQNSLRILIALAFWLVLQAVLGLVGFYTIPDGIPPRFVFLLGPMLLVTIGLFISKQGKDFLDHLDVKTLTLLHIVRIPVELVLFQLFICKAVPELMTFEGRNFDILSGLSAPFVYYFGYIKNVLNKNVLLVWNIICLGLLINIVTNAILSAQTPFQQFAFDQPNIAILYFPFVWLPSCVVPLVLLSHLATIRHLLK